MVDAIGWRRVIPALPFTADKLIVESKAGWLLFEPLDSALNGELMLWPAALVIDAERHKRMPAKTVASFAGECAT